MLTVFAAEMLNESVSMTILSSVVMLTNQEVLCICVRVFQQPSISTIVYIHTQAKKGSIITVDFFFFSGPLLVSHAPALLSGIFIPILQSTNRL